MSDAPPPTAKLPPALTAPARAALWRGGVAALFLAVAVPLVSLRGLSGARLNVLLAVGLGLVIGVLTAAEHLVRRGRVAAGVAWGGLIALVGVLLASAQAGYTESMLSVGPAKALDLTYQAVWLALYDPLTLPVVGLWTVALAAPPLARCLGGRRALAALAGALLAAALVGTPLLVRRDGLMLGVNRGGVYSYRWGLPVGAELNDNRSVGRIGLGETLAAAIAGDRPYGERPMCVEALMVALVLALGGALAAALGDRLTTAPPRDDDDADGELAPLLVVPRLPLALSAGVVVALAWVGGRAPFASHVPWLLALDMFSTERVLKRVGVADRSLLPPLFALLDDPLAKDRYTVAWLIGRIGPPFAREEVESLKRAAAGPDALVAAVALRTVVQADAVTPAWVRRLFRDRILTGARPEHLNELRSGLVFVPSWARFDPIDELSRDADPAVAIPALTLETWGTKPESALERLATHLADPVHGAAAARGMARGDEAAVRFVRARLSSAADPAADPILRVLPLLPHFPDTLALLTEALGSPSPAVRAAALAGLDGAGPNGPSREAVDVLLDRLTREPDADDLLPAVASHGEQASSAIDERLETATVPRVRFALERALEMTLSR